ncbi:MAG: response regulator [Actinomycetota bacterium]|nr:response regulator [Actinomycetota bacterium]
MQRATPLEVLLIEDDELDAELAIADLRRAAADGVKVRRAGTLRDGIEALRSDLPDAVIVDLGLPDSQGTATFEHIHAEALDTTVVVLSGAGDEATALACVAAGAEDYVHKHDLGGAFLFRAVAFATERNRARRLALAAQLDELVALRTAAQSGVAAARDGDDGPSAADADGLDAAVDVYADLLHRFDSGAVAERDDEFEAAVGELVGLLGRAGMGTRELIDIHLRAIRDDRAELGDAAAVARAASGRLLMLRLTAELLGYYQRKARSSTSV